MYLGASEGGISYIFIYLLVAPLIYVAGLHTHLIDVTGKWIFRLSLNISSRVHVRVVYTTHRESRAISLA